MKDIFNYWYYDEKLSSSGMPTAEQFKQIAEAGAQVVINLALKTSRGAVENEEALVESLGMQYVHIPVIWENPTQQDLHDFFNAMEAHKGEHVFVHCQANYRASSFIMLYRVQRLGWKKEDAIDVMERMWNPEDFPVWQTFIEAQLKNA